jgi:hypothetical protein
MAWPQLVDQASSPPLYPTMMSLIRTRRAAPGVVGGDRIGVVPASCAAGTEIGDAGRAGAVEVPGRLVGQRRLGC